MSVQDAQEEHVAFYKKRLFWCVIFFIAVCAIGVSAVRSDAAKDDAKESSRYFVSRSTAVSATDEAVRTSGEDIITTSETETTAVNTDSTSGAEKRALAHSIFPLRTPDFYGDAIKKCVRLLPARGNRTHEAAIFR